MVERHKQPRGAVEVFFYRRRLNEAKDPTVSVWLLLLISLIYNN